ncbi:restriction endonuclease [Kitasatospora sp. NPDC048343]|uniref:restriction endonuclease n=1 Tax=Kitasatospora sp. NPDC048343 TaxID=3154717 RepID=UPI003408FD70
MDAVAALNDPTGSRVFAIPAKCSKKAVPVNTVRALAGVMHDKGAGYGIPVTTSWFGKAGYDFAHRNGRLRLIDGRNLKALHQCTVRSAGSSSDSAGSVLLTLVRNSSR